MADLDFQNLSTVQSGAQPKIPTITAAATVVPTTCMSFISGTTAIVNITPPVTGFHILYFWPLAAFTTTTAGNLTAALTAAVGAPVVLFFNPATLKYHPAEIPVAA